MKSPEEIKEALKKCSSGGFCHNHCPYAVERDSEYTCSEIAMSDALEYIDNLEERVAIVTERPIAHWMNEDGNLIAFNSNFEVYALRGSAYCSNCGEELIGSDEYACKGRFCPSCGAEMINKE